MKRLTFIILIISIPLFAKMPAKVKLTPEYQKTFYQKINWHIDYYAGDFFYNWVYLTDFEYYIIPRKTQKYYGYFKEEEVGGTVFYKTSDNRPLPLGKELDWAEHKEETRDITIPYSIKRWDEMPNDKAIHWFNTKSYTAEVRDYTTNKFNVMKPIFKEFELNLSDKWVTYNPNTGLNMAFRDTKQFYPSVGWYPMADKTWVFSDDYRKYEMVCYDHSVTSIRDYPENMRIWNGTKTDDKIGYLPMIDEIPVGVDGKQKIYNKDAVFIYTYNFKELRKHAPIWYTHDRMAFGVDDQTDTDKMTPKFKTYLDYLDQTETIIAGKTPGHVKLRNYYYPTERDQQVKLEWVKKERERVLKMDLSNQARVTYPPFCDVNDSNLQMYRAGTYLYMLKAADNIVRDTHPAPEYKENFDYLIKPGTPASDKTKWELIEKYSVRGNIFKISKQFVDEVVQMNIYDYWRGCTTTAEEDNKLYSKALNPILIGTVQDNKTAMEDGIIYFRKWYLNKIYIAMHGYMSAIPANKATKDFDLKEYFTSKYLSVGIWAGSNGYDKLKHYSLSSPKTNFPYFEGDNRPGVMAVEIDKKERRYWTEEKKYFKNGKTRHQAILAVQKEWFNNTNGHVCTYDTAQYIVDACIIAKKIMEERHDVYFIKDKPGEYLHRDRYGEWDGDFKTADKIATLEWEIGWMLIKDYPKAWPDQYNYMAPKFWGSKEYIRKTLKGHELAKFYGKLEYENVIKAFGFLQSELFEYDREEVYGVKSGFKIAKGGHTMNTGGLVYGGFVDGDKMESLISDRGSAKQVWQDALNGPLMVVSDRCYDKYGHGYFEKISGKKLIHVDITPALIMELSRLSDIPAKDSFDYDKQLRRSTEEINKLVNKIGKQDYFKVGGSKEFKAVNVDAELRELSKISGIKLTINDIPYDMHKVMNIYPDEFSDPKITKFQEEDFNLAAFNSRKYYIYEGKYLEFGEDTSGWIEAEWDHINNKPKEDIKEFYNDKVVKTYRGRTIPLQEWIDKSREARIKDIELYPEINLLPGVSQPYAEGITDMGKMIDPLTEKPYTKNAYYTIYSVPKTQESKWVVSGHTAMDLILPQHLDSGYIRLLFDLWEHGFWNSFTHRMQVKYKFNTDKFKWTPEIYKDFAKEMAKIYPPFMFSPHLFEYYMENMYSDVSRLMVIYALTDYFDWTGVEGFQKSGYQSNGYDYIDIGNTKFGLYWDNSKINEIFTDYFASLTYCYSYLNTSYEAVSTDGRIRKNTFKDNVLFDQHERTIQTQWGNSFPNRNKYTNEYNMPSVSYGGTVGHNANASSIPRYLLQQDMFLKVDISTIVNASTKYIYYGALYDEGSRSPEKMRAYYPYDHIDNTSLAYLSVKVNNK